MVNAAKEKVCTVLTNTPGTGNNKRIPPIIAVNISGKAKAKFKNKSIRMLPE